MANNKVQKRIEKLKKVINYHRYLYHVLNKEEISPEALDSLKHELYSLEKQYPQFVTPDSPTQRVEGKPLEKFSKVKHDLLMLSIEDVFSEEELKDWEDYIKKLSHDEKIDYFCELKIDGFAISLVYTDGVFFQGSTRGDGKTGEDVTQNLKTIDSIPLRLTLNNSSHLPKRILDNIQRLITKGTIEIRGEVYMEEKDFEKFNEARRKDGEKPYSNPRNLAAGSIRQLDSKLAAKRPLKFLAYDLVTEFGQNRHSKEHEILPCLGFKTDEGKKCRNTEEIVDFQREVSKKRSSLPFQIDGIVISVDQNNVFQKLGIAGKSPRGARAFKFSPKQATTKVLDIKLQVGRTGAVTPVAYLEPVVVGGAKISRATLHNEDQIKRLGVRVGDTVIIERAGDVIPAVVKVLTELRTGKERKFTMPKKCPICKTELKKEDVLIRCPNPDCQSRKRKLLYHFVSRKAFDIEGLGPQIIFQLINNNLISQPADMFSLTEGDLVPLERFAEKSASNIIEAIKNSKEISLDRFIYSLGIRHVGEETAIDLAHYFGSIDKIKAASKDTFERIPDIGPEVSDSLYNWFKDKDNMELVSNLLKAGVKVIPPSKFGEKLKGKTFVITGVLEKLTREEAEKKIRSLGGSPANSVSKNTSFLVAGENPGSKLDKARKLGIKIIREADFFKMIS